MSNIVIRRDGSRFISVAVQAAVVPIEDWDSRLEGFPNGMRVLSISMTPTAIGDTVIISDGDYGFSGEVFSNVALHIGDVKTRHFPGVDHKGVLMTPLINALTNVGNFLITFELA